MKYNKRLDRIEDKIAAGGPVELVWLEPDENGEFPPVQPGEVRINLLWPDEMENRRDADEPTTPNDDGGISS